FVTKIAASENPCTLTCSALVPAVVGIGSVATFSAAALSNCPGAATYQWNFGDGTAVAIDQNSLHTYSASGSYTWMLTVGMSGAPPCTKSGTILVVVPSRRRP
ncbi:MAG TPA: PKD domain-containing protein, partial [Acidobacteriota bacterium]